MAISSSAHITDKVIAPVSESGTLSNHVTQGFYATYQAMYARREKDEDSNGDRERSSTINDEKKGGQSDEGVLPEIFKLLEKYNFEDFFSLAISRDGARMSMIIMNGRKDRGVNRLLPISPNHKKSSTFINRIHGQYLGASWLMKAKLGQSFSAVL